MDSKYIIKTHKAKSDYGATMDYYVEPKHWDLLPYKKTDHNAELIIFPTENACYKAILDIKKEMTDAWGAEYCDGYLFEIIKLY